MRSVPMRYVLGVCGRCRHGRAACTRHVAVWNDGHAHHGALLVAKLSVLGDAPQEPVPEVGVTSR